MIIDSNTLFIAISVIFLLIIVSLLFLLRKYINEAQNPHASKFQSLIDQEVASKIKVLEAENEIKITNSINEKTRLLDELNKQKEEILLAELRSRSELQLEKEKLNQQQSLQQEEQKIRNKLSLLQDKLDEKEDQLNQKQTALEQLKVDLTLRENNLIEQINQLTAKERNLDTQYEEKMTQLSGLTPEELKQKMIDDNEKEISEDLGLWQSKYIENFEENAYDKAREIAVLAIQRCSSEVANEFTITTVKLSNEEDKGKLIGKQGRNIQWLEKTLGIELIIDDTPGVITISGFSSIRRYLAKKTIEKLLEDGRVHPSSIEEMYDKAKGEIAQEIYEAGQWAVSELGIYDFPPKLIKLIGRLKFRTGYGQNVLKHSVEMAKLAGLLADGINAEFRLKNPIDRMVCVKGAFLHDIGKAVDEEQNPKGNHVEIGEKICDMFDLDWKIRKCISSHHTTGGDRQSYWDESRKQVCLEAAIVDTCDTLSSGRPGARKETMEAYFQRLEALENVANKVPGVTKSWIMRGASELWVFFDAENISPTQVYRTTRKLARDINTSVKTPKEIKVIGIREDRVVVNRI
jgi:ribonucrease Y